MQVDVLADVLSHYRVSGRVYCVSDLSAPWALQMKRSTRAHFHVLERGGGWLLRRGSKPRAVAAGDLVIVIDGGGHILADRPDVTSGRSLPAPGGSAPHFLSSGGGGAETRLICGGFEIADRARNPLLALLPPMIHIESRTAGRWLTPLLDLLAQESRAAEPGREMVLTRLTEIIFVQALRVWLSMEAHEASGWLRALRDPQIGRALAMLHAAPQEAWSVDSLAREVGMSRSPFFERFRDAVGEPPLRYLTRWRMHLAARLLREGKRVSEAAAAAGYASEAAFSSAFKRELGQAPAKFRKEGSG